MKHGMLRALTVLVIMMSLTLMATTTDQVVSSPGEKSLSLVETDTQPMAGMMIYQMPASLYDGLVDLTAAWTYSLTQASYEDEQILDIPALSFSPLDQVITYREDAAQQDIPPVSKGEYDGSMIPNPSGLNREPAKPQPVPRI